jgi:hypothetical protein
MILPPNPGRLIEGLRDTGYDFNTALADVVDNSVDAEASKVIIRIQMDAFGETTITIADNGIGMNESELENAMTYGAKSKKLKSRLGKFGLGLKTASTAFCRRLSVISRGKESGALRKLTWDLDHVAEAREWEVLQDPPTMEEIEWLEEACGGGSGTIVVWEKVDRLLKDYQDPAGKPARKGLRKIEDSFRDHASSVYQRFLDPTDGRARSIEMTLNGEPIKAWDPFCENVKGTELVGEIEQEVEFRDDQGTLKGAKFHMRAFVLPRREEFPDQLSAREARLGTKSQGLYVYRENRQIHAGDWMGMFSIEPHLNLLRVEFSFDHELDEAFQVDIMKSRILLRDELYNFVRDNFLTAPRRAAEDRYRKGQKQKTAEKSKGAHQASNKSIGSKEHDLHTATVTPVAGSSNEAEIVNKSGRFRIKIPITTAANPDEVNVQPVPSIDDGLLWQPAIIDGHHAVQVNTGHQYYSKVYVPNLASGVTIQGMDSLLWALIEAELGATAEGTQKHFRELRYEVSRILRTLVEDLPEPDLGDDEG